MQTLYLYTSSHGISKSTLIKRNIIKNRGVNIPIDPKKIAKFCFLVVLCEVGSTLQHVKSRKKWEYGKV